jgi:GDP-4-dehydro-6-deoxy-D-mannose reductase
MKKALITGASGFVGKYLLKELKDYDYVVIGTDIDYTKEHGFDRFYKSDISNFDQSRQLLNDIKPDEIYHLAAISNVKQSYQLGWKTYDVNLRGTYNLLESIRENDMLDVKMLFIGSSDCYGVIKDEKVPETKPLKPINPYSVSKASADMLCYQYYKNFKINVIRTRSFNHTGIGQRDTFVIPSFINQVIKSVIDKDYKVYTGDLSPIRDFSDVEDVVKAYRQLMEKGEVGEVYNVCSGRGYSINEVLEYIIEISGEDIKVISDKDRFRPTESPKIVGDNSKLKRIIDFDFKDIFRVIDHMYNKMLKEYRNED